MPPAPHSEFIAKLMRGIHQMVCSIAFGMIAAILILVWALTAVLFRWGANHFKPANDQPAVQNKLGRHQLATDDKSAAIESAWR